MKAFRVIGGNASPYSMKMRAIFRYRRIPHIWLLRTPDVLAELADVRPLIVPVVEFPDGERRTDSTPIAYALEEMFPGERSILPPGPGRAFLCHLIEDMADEWLTKAMFHYRFSYDADRAYGPFWVIDDAVPGLDDAAFAAAVAAFRERQTGRMALVGCTPENAPAIEASYHRILAILEGYLRHGRYLFGSRPSLADFGLFGQLKTLATDPTPLAIMRAEAPHTEHWLRRLDDASGVEGDWLAEDAALPQAVAELLAVAGDTYLPFLLANERAIEAGESELELELGGQPFRQGVFRYQQKCLTWLRAEFAGLDAASRAAITPQLRDSGCLPALQR